MAANQQIHYTLQENLFSNESFLKLAYAMNKSQPDACFLKLTLDNQPHPPTPGSNWLFSNVE